MKFKKVLIFTLIIISVSCKSGDICKVDKNCYEIVDKSELHFVDSKYNFIKSKLKNKSQIEFKIFDRASGNEITEAIIFINNKETLNYSKADTSFNIQEGIYNISITSFDNLPLNIKDFNVNKGEKILITCYLGSSLQ